MVTRTTYTEARANFAKLWDSVTADRETVIVSRRGAADLALIAADELSGLIETVNLLRSPRNAQRLLTALNRGLEQTEVPQTPDDLRRDLGLDAGPQT